MHFVATKTVDFAGEMVTIIVQLVERDFKVDVMVVVTLWSDIRRNVIC